jgi:GT2 family glycosyltransferase
MILDNGSTDGLKEIAENEAKKDNVFAFISPENIGAAGIWNVGARFGFEELECGKVIILNNDTLLLPDTIDRMVEDLDDIGTVLASATNVSANFAEADDFLHSKNGSKNTYKEEPNFSCFGINELCWKLIGPFDEAFFPAYFEDNDYHTRIKLEKLKATRNLGNNFYHFGSRTKQKSKNYGDYINMRYIANRDYYVSKWGGIPGEEKYREPFNGDPPPEIKLEEFDPKKAYS